VKRRGKYRPRFAKQLAGGMRLTGKTIVQCCLAWGVTRQCYYDWIKEYPKFAEAAELGEMHFQSWAWDKYKEGLSGETPVNAGLMTLLAKNSLGMVDKVEHDHQHTEKITTIQIEILPQNNGKIIEHEPLKAITDQQPG